MSDVFDVNQASWSYQEIVPNVLRSTQLPLPPAKLACSVVPKHSSAYWTRVTDSKHYHVSCLWIG
jgi:hypothetical protein